MKAFPFRRFYAAAFTLPLLLATVSAQTAEVASAVPHLVKYAGIANATPQGEPVNVRFAIYENQTGGESLWNEIQTVTPDANGKFAVVLGATTSEGLPQSAFAAAQAKWLGVTLAGGEEQPRTLLTASAYALKATDSETVGGHPASDFVLARKDSSGKPQTATAVTQITTGAGILGGGTGPTISLNLDPNYLADLGNSEYAQLTANNNLVGNQTIRGNLAVSGTISGSNMVSSIAGVNGVVATHNGSAYSITLDPAFIGSQLNQYYAQLNAPNTFHGAQTFSSPVSFASTQTFPGTATLAGANTFAGTNSFASPVTFASGQTYPGAIASVTASSPVLATTISGATVVSLDTPTLEATLNSVFAQLGAANTFAMPITFASVQTFPGVASLTAANTFAGAATFSAPVSFAGPQTFPGTATLAGNNTFANPITFATAQSFPGVASLSTANTFAGATSFSAPVTFTSGQAFPGTLTGVTAGTGITSTTISGVATVAVNPASLETTYDSRYAMLSGPNTFADPIIFASTQTYPGAAMLTGTNTFANPITFAAGQTYPGAGTITGVTAGTGLTGGGPTGAVTLNVNAAALESTYNSVYAQLGTANTFSGSITFASGQTFPGTASLSASNTYSGTQTFSTPVVFAAGQTMPSSAALAGNNAFSGNNSFANAVSFGAGQAFPGTASLSSANTFAGANTFAAPVSFASGQSFPGTAVLNAANTFAGSTTFAGTASFSAPVTFVSGQSFPGTGTINGVTAGSGLTGGGSSGSVTLAVDPSALESTYNNVYASLAGNNSYTGSNTFSHITVSGNANIAGNETLNGGLAVQGNANFLSPVTFSSGQTFPGTGSGTITNVVAGSGLVGGGGSGSISLTVDAAALESTYNSVYAGLNANNGFNGNNFFTGNNFFNGIASTAAIFTNNATNATTVYIENQGMSDPFVVENGATATGCSIDSNANLYCNGTQIQVQPVRGRVLATYSVHSAENWNEDFGSGRLASGAAHITLEPSFAETVNTGVEYHVFLTPRGDSEGLYVVNAGPEGFEVREARGGRSSINFDYRIVARTKGHETERLADVTEKMASHHLNVKGGPVAVHGTASLK